LLSVILSSVDLAVYAVGTNIFIIIFCFVFHSWAS